MASTSAAQGSLIGASIGGYEVQTLIGRGAMGTVYLARDVKLNRQVALKVLLGSLARTPSIVKQFQLEAQAAAPLNHPGIVRVYAAGIERGTPFMAMEFVDGEPLDRFMRRVGRLKWQQAFHIVGQVALALQCAHENGIVHRDVKPANIMLDRGGGIRLTDFGIASIQSDDSGDGAAPIIGTPQYMSPEQVKGERVGPASDLFSLGVTLYQMISGELPFRGESSMALIKSICIEEPPRLNKIQQSVPDDVARLVAYLLEKRPEKRPANAKTVAALMQRIQEHKGGNSALPAALTAYIKEQAQPRAFSNYGQTSPRDNRKSTAQRRQKRRVSGRILAQAATVIAIALAALAVSPVMSNVAREGDRGVAATINLGNFRELGSGIVMAQLYSDGYIFDEISWLGNESVALASARGTEGSLTAGAFGLLAVHPVERRFWNVRAPLGPSLDREFWSGTTPKVFSTRVPLMPDGSPLLDMLLVQVRERSDGPALLLGQRWYESSPRPAILYQTAGESLIQAMVKPDGATLGLLIEAEGGRGAVLVEREVSAKPLNRVGRALTSRGNPIVAESLQYSPTGRHIAYTSATAADTRELWILDPDDNSTDGTRVARDVAGDEFSFSPNGERIAVSVQGAGALAPAAVVVDIDDGRVIAELGRGWVCRDAWLKSGQRLLLIDEGVLGAGAGRPQLWSAEILPPFHRVQLTFLANGVERDYAVSRNGQWAAVAPARESFPTVVFLDLSQVSADAAVAAGINAAAGGAVSGGAVSGGPVPGGAVAGEE